MHATQDLPLCLDVSLNEVSINFYLDPDAKFQHLVTEQMHLHQRSLCIVVLSNIKQDADFSDALNISLGDI